MDDTNGPINDRHTIVCEIERHLLTSYRALIAFEIEKRKLTLTSVAEDTGTNRRSLKRMLMGEQELRARDIIVICHVLDIDRSVATFAIEAMGDWRHYYNDTLRVALCLVRPVVTKVSDRATGAIEALTPTAAETLSNWLADNLIRNQEQIHTRRERFADLPRL